MKFKKILASVLSAVMMLQSLTVASFAEQTDKDYRDLSELCGLEQTKAIALTDEEVEEMNRIVAADYAKSDSYNTTKSAFYDYSTDYYYNQMNDVEKKLYDDIKIACDNFIASNVNLSTDMMSETITYDTSITKDRMVQVYRAFYYSNPQYFFLSNGYYYSTSGGAMAPMIIQGEYESFLLDSTRDSYESKITSVTNSWLTEINKLSDVLEKERWIADQICNTVDYVFTDYDQSLAGALVDKECVCNGYAMTFAYFCNAIGLDTITVVSYNHAWNRINLYGSWYEVDTTWMDATEYGYINYNWYNKSHNTFLANDQESAHVIDYTYATGLVFDVPACNSDTVTVPAVSGLKATAGDKSVKLTWTKMTGATKYRVQRTTGSSWSTIDYPTTNSYTDTGLTNGTTYKYRVLAYVNGTWTTPSASVSAKPFSAIPQNLKATAGNKKVTLSWSAVSGATKYRLQRTTGSSWSTISYPTTASYTDTSVTNGTTYKYRVLAYVNGAWGTASSAVSATPKAATTVPQNVKATAGDKKVTITWSAVSGATKYRLQRTTGSSWSTIVYPTTTSYVDTSVTNGTTYKYRVLAYVNGAWSSASSVVSATPFNATPQNVKATAGDKSVKLTWTAVSGATKYRVQRLNGSTWSTISYPTTTSYTDTSVANGTTYKYRVLAYVNGAWGTASSAVSATPKAATTVPQNVKATAGDKKVTITWSAVSGATKYRLQRTTGSSWSTIVYPTTTSYTDTGLTNGTTYKYRVLAYVNGAWGSASSVVSVTPESNAPEILNVRISDGVITLSYTAVSGATKYRVQVYNGTSWVTLGYSASTSFVDTDLTRGSYKYRVLAYVDGEWGTPSDVFSFIYV